MVPLDTQIIGLPLASNTDIQQVIMLSKTAISADIGNTIYNSIPIGVDPVTGNVKTLRTIVLGIIDPTDGKWHSMWDIGALPVPAADDDTGHSLPRSFEAKSIQYGEHLPAFKTDNPFQGSIVDYIDDLNGAHVKLINNL